MVGDTLAPDDPMVDRIQGSFDYVVGPLLPVAMTRGTRAGTVVIRGRPIVQRSEHRVIARGNITLNVAPILC